MSLFMIKNLRVLEAYIILRAVPAAKGSARSEKLFFDKSLAIPEHRIEG